MKRTCGHATTQRKLLATVFSWFLWGFPPGSPVLLALVLLPFSIGPTRAEARHLPTASSLDFFWPIKERILFGQAHDTISKLLLTNSLSAFKIAVVA